MSSNTSYKVVLSLFVLVVLSACSPDKTKDEKADETVFKIPVETAQVTIGRISNTYKTTAVLEARAESRVVNKVTGMIEKILVEEGMFVNKGDVLAEIDSENYLLELERTTIDLESAEAEFKRSQPVDGRQLVAIKDYEQLEFQVKTRKNQQKVAAIQVRDTKVRAPISGVIAQRMVKEGNMTPSTGAEMFSIVALDSLQGVVYLPESEINNVHIDQQAFLDFPSTEQAIPASVSLISPVIDTDSGTFKVTLSVNNDDYRLKPGMFARVSLTLDVRENAQLVPLKAITMTDTETSLFVVRDNKAKKVTVNIGYEQDGFVEVLTPLNLDEPIVTVGQQSLKVGSEVRILNQQRGSASEMADAVSSANNANASNAAN
jgi:RND family efflux transporter MFP subunit